MKRNPFFTVVFLFCFILFAGVFPASGKPPAASPEAFMPKSSYIFDPVVEGTKITHDFVIQNNGAAPLKIEKVKTG